MSYAQAWRNVVPRRVHHHIIQRAAHHRRFTIGTPGRSPSRSQHRCHSDSRPANKRECSPYWPVEQRSAGSRRKTLLDIQCQYACALRGGRCQLRVAGPITRHPPPALAMPGKRFYRSDQFTIVGAAAGADLLRRAVGSSTGCATDVSTTAAEGLTTALHSGSVIAG